MGKYIAVFTRDRFPKQVAEFKVDNQADIRRKETIKDPVKKRGRSLN